MFPKNLMNNFPGGCAPRPRCLFVSQSESWAASTCECAILSQKLTHPGERKETNILITNTIFNNQQFKEGDFHTIEDASNHSKVDL